ncbi:unnamed protein product [Rhodiola kirilowii]
MSRIGSHHEDEEINDEVNQVVRDNEGPPPFIDNPEQLILNHNRAIREAARLNQGMPEGRVGAAPRQHPRQHPRQPPLHRQIPRQHPAFDEYYADEVLREPTMGELSAPDFGTQPWCIDEGPDLENIVINTSVVHNLPKFSGNLGESATTHLQRLHGICQNLKPYGVDVDDFKLKAFYFSLTNSANDWFLSLPSGSIQTWAQMQKKFVEKYYPAGRAMQVRRQLQEIRQGPNETMYEYLEKFNHLERSCCTLGLPEKLIIEYLLDGLRPLDKKLLDASAGGSMMNLPLSGIRELVTSVAENARFREETTRQEEFSRIKNVAQAEVPMSSLPEEMKQMKEMMIQLLRRQPAQMRPCEFCGGLDHKTDTCLTLMENDPEEVNAFGQAPGQNWRYNNNAPRRTQQAAPQLAQQFYQPPHRQYNQGGPGQYPPKGPNQYQAGPSQQGPSKPLEEIVKDLSNTVHQYMAKTDGAIADLGKQMSQLATEVSELKNESGRLPSQTIQNPKGIINMVRASDMKAAMDEAEQLRKQQRRGPEAYKPTTKHYTRRQRPDWNQEKDRPNDDGTWVTHADNGRYAFAVNMTPPPTTHFDVPASGWNDEGQNSSYPTKAIVYERRATRKMNKNLESRNDPMASKPVTRNREEHMGISKDPGAFTVTCSFGKIKVHHCLIDPGAAVNVLPYPLYCSLGLGPLQPPRISLEMGDKSCVQPVGVLESLLLRVGKIVVPTDFYVIPIKEFSKDDPPTIILGRPFLYTTDAKINMGKGSLSLAFSGKTSYYNIYGDNRTNMKKPPEHCSPNPSTSSSKKSGRDEARIDTGAPVKFDLSHPWDPSW